MSVLNLVAKLECRGMALLVPAIVTQLVRNDVPIAVELVHPLPLESYTHVGPDAKSIWRDSVFVESRDAGYNSTDKSIKEAGMLVYSMPIS